MSSKLRRVPRALVDILWRAPRGLGKPIAAEYWDRDFAGGGWDHLEGPAEVARYAVIHAYATALKPRGVLCDVGCGAGILRSRFSDEEIESYTGIDLSSEAIRQATALGFPKTEFIACDFDHFASEERYDLVLFNESIYYAPDPAKTFANYEMKLKPGGSVIVSIHDYNLRSRLIWARIERYRTPRLATRIINERKQVWDVKVFAA